MMQILLFNCMSVRDPSLLLPRLRSKCIDQGVFNCLCHDRNFIKMLQEISFESFFKFSGVDFKRAVFVPNVSVYNQVGSSTNVGTRVESMSWQFGLQRIWESLARGEAKSNSKSDSKGKEEEKSFVFSSLPVAVDWLRDNARQSKQVRFQVNSVCYFLRIMLVSGDNKAA